MNIILYLRKRSKACAEYLKKCLTHSRGPMELNVACFHLDDFRDGCGAQSTPRACAAMRLLKQYWIGSDQGSELDVIVGPQ